MGWGARGDVYPDKHSVLQNVLSSPSLTCTGLGSGEELAQVFFFSLFFAFLVVDKVLHLSGLTFSDGGRGCTTTPKVPKPARAAVLSWGDGGYNLGLAHGRAPRSSPR